jgi:hypothetical protein
VTVYNRGSLLRDHTTYWTNRDEFIADLVVRLAELDPQVAADFADHGAEFARARRRRQWRVGWLVACRWTALLAGGVAVARARDEWVPLLGDAVARVAGLIGVDVESPPTTYAEAAGALGPAAAVLTAYVAAATAWRALDRAEAARLLARRPPTAQAAETVCALSVVVLVLTSGWAAAPGLVGHWPEGVRGTVAVGVFVAVLMLWFATQLRSHVFTSASADTGTAVGGQARAERAGQVIWRLILWVARIIGAALAAAALWELVRREPAVGILVGAIVALVVLAQVQRGRRRPIESQRRDHPDVHSDG